MSTFLKLLPLTLKDLEEKDFIEPGVERKEDENYVGVMSDDLRKLWTYWQILAREGMKETAEVAFGGSNSDEHMGKLGELKEKSDLIRKLFWIAIRDEFGLWIKPSVAVRKGWEIVWTEEEESPYSGLLDFLRGKP